MDTKTFQPVPLRQLVWKQGGKNTIYTGIYLNCNGKKYLITKSLSTSDVLCDLETRDEYGEVGGTRISVSSKGSEVPCFVQLIKTEVFQLKEGALLHRPICSAANACPRSVWHAVPRIRSSASRGRSRSLLSRYLQVRAGRWLASNGQNAIAGGS